MFSRPRLRLSHLFLALLVGSCASTEQNLERQRLLEAVGGGGRRSLESLLSVGTTDAAELLHYHFTDGSPYHCQTPDRLFDALSARISKVHGPCRAQKVVSGEDVSLVLRCNLLNPATGCTETYTGQMWIERDPHSLSDYDLLAQGRVRSVCPATGEFPASHEFREEVERPSDEIEAVLKPCRQEPVP